LPRALGREARAQADLDRALAVLGGAPGRVPAAARACIEGNARLALARIHIGRGQPEAARPHLERARAIDPGGPLASASDAALSQLVVDPAG
jgi:Tfp pilus assembly protein PilF